MVAAPSFTGRLAVNRPGPCIERAAQLDTKDALSSDGRCGSREELLTSGDSARTRSGARKRSGGRLLRGAFREVSTHLRRRLSGVCCDGQTLFGSGDLKVFADRPELRFCCAGEVEALGFVLDSHQETT